ncbi:monocarboxylate transporter 13 [Phlebotomus argentipes]|uniref:monocarboxylate transporter 13 n=1 Tax=Phlebotomus argentipes TaxID=94469 RepID=UPI002892FC1B|nr:monocarboxylate transporter 13 [Phlebotomus argentipes]
MSLPREWSVQDSRESIYRSIAQQQSWNFPEIDRMPSKKDAFNFNCDGDFKHVQQSVNSPLLLGECNGSLFSIHSAPPVAQGGTDSPRRPVSLAIDPQCLPAVALPASEPDEEDNENLLTVSSLTARPLIAKSRELRSFSKLTEYRKKERLLENRTDVHNCTSWLIVFGAFSVQFWVAGLVKSYGVLHVEVMETFPKSSAALASWIPAILSALCLLLAPISSALCQRFSCRTVVFVGGVFCALGLTCSYFATNLIHLFFTFGVLTGIGGGLSTTPGIIIVSQYFDEHRALVNGIVVSGTAAGSFVFPMLIERLVHAFGFHGTILILGGCMLHVCASASLYRPSDAATEAEICSTISSHHTTSRLNTASTTLSSSEDPLNAKKHINHLFVEDAKNQINDLYNSNKFISITEKNLQENSDDECKDVVGETIFMKPIKSMRSSSILHSVEDLSTDSTCVYKSRTGFDSNRGSRRRNKNAGSTDEILAKIPPVDNNLSIPMTTNRGLSKSMIIPTPVSDFSEYGASPKKARRNSCVMWIEKYLDVSLLKEPVFILMCLSVTLMSTGSPYMLYYLPAYVLSAGYTKTEAGYLVAVSAALDLLGRLGFGWLSDLQIFDRKKAYITCIFGAGLAVLIIPLANSWYVLSCAAGAYGFCLGSWYLLMPVLLADIFGTDRISSSYGLVRMFQGVGAISIPPLAGFLRDLSGGYEICFFCMGACMMLGSLPILIVSLMESSSNASDTEGSTVS